MSREYSMCDNCNHVPMCAMQYDWEGGCIRDLESPQGEHLPGGALCVKAYGLIQQREHPGRLTKPLLRISAKGEKARFREVSWDEAYDFAAKNLLGIREKYGADSVFFYCGAPKEPRAVVQRLAALFGSINYGSETSTACMRAAAFANWLTFGWNALQQIPGKETQTAVLWCINPAVAHHYAMPKFLAARDRGCRFLLVDPRETDTVRLLKGQGSLHIRPRPGTTGALAHALARVLIMEKRTDESWNRQHIQGYDEYCAMLERFTPEEGERITGVPAADIVQAARMLGDAVPSSFFGSSQSTTHDVNGVQNHRAFCMLGALCQAVKPGQPREPLPGFSGHPHGGPAEFGMRKYFLSDPSRRIDTPYVPAWAHWAWEVNTSYLPEAVAQGKIRAFVGFGLNVSIWPSPKVYSQALANMDFAMAADYFYRPKSHEHMDLILPAAVNFERSVPFGVNGDYFWGRTALPPLGEARDDWRIALELGCHLGYEEQCFHGDAEAACDAMLKPWGVSMQQLRDALPAAVQVRSSAENIPPAMKDERVLYPTASGKIEAWSDYLEKYALPPLPEYKECYPLSPEYPFRLMTGTRRPHLTHTRTRGDCPWLLELDPVPQVEINPDDAASLGIENGCRVRLLSSVDSIELWAQVLDSMPRGVLGMMHGWPGADANDLIPRDFDPISGYAPLKQIPVRLEKL